MKVASLNRSGKRGGFTLIEIMLAMAIFAMALAAIYACWMLVMKSSKIGIEAAAQAQRERIAVRMVEEALNSVRSFQLDVQHYSFFVENGQAATLSFVAQLPDSFPRSGKFGDFTVRRVTFSVEAGEDGENQLVLRQNPILMDPDEDERDHPLVLAHGVKEFLVEMWDPQTSDWIDTWTQTNQLPLMTRVTLTFNTRGQSVSGSYSQTYEQISRTVALPSIAVPSTVQTPQLGGGNNNNRRTGGQQGGQQGGQPGGRQGGQPNPGQGGGVRLQ